MPHYATGFVEDGLLMSHECYQVKCCDDPGGGGGGDPCNLDCESCQTFYQIVTPSWSFDFNAAFAAFTGVTTVDVPQSTMLVEKNNILGPCDWRSAGQVVVTGGSLYEVRLSVGSIIAFCDFPTDPGIPCAVEVDSVWQFWRVAYEWRITVDTALPNPDSISAFYCATTASRDCPPGSYEYYDDIYNPSLGGSTIETDYTLPPIITVENL